MDLYVHPGKLHGEYFTPPSKSDLHRALICAAFADKPTTLYLPSGTELSDDIYATIRCLEALGAMIYPHYDISCYGTDVFLIEKEGENENDPPKNSGVISSILVSPIKNVPSEADLDCGESGSTLRFLLPAASSVCPRVHFSGHGRLPERPLSPLPEEMSRHGFFFSAEKLPFTVTCPENTHPGIVQEYTLPGNISSQYISGLLLMGALGGGVRITLTTPLESAPYVDMTIRTLAAFGVEVSRPVSKDGAEQFSIGPAERLHSPGACFVEGDWSNAAFFLAAELLTGGQPVYAATGTDLNQIPENEDENLIVYGLSDDSAQGDRLAPDLVGAFLTGTIPASCREILYIEGQEASRFEESSQYSGLSADSAADPAAMLLDAKDIPDLVPVLSVSAYLAGRPLRITGSARLRLKESDRIETTVTMLRALGADAEALPDGLRIGPCSADRADEASYNGTAAADNISAAVTKSYYTVDASGDHRIAMSAAVAGICGDRPVLIRGAEAAAKSYPDFYEDLKSLGILCQPLK